LLAAAALGSAYSPLRGDDPSSGPAGPKPVFDLDTTALLATGAADAIRAPLPSGTEIKGACSSCSARGIARRPAGRLAPRRLALEMEAGAEFIQTQFCHGSPKRCGATRRGCSIWVSRKNCRF